MLRSWQGNFKGCVEVCHLTNPSDEGFLYRQNEYSSVPQQFGVETCTKLDNIQTALMFSIRKQSSRTVSPSWDAPRWRRHWETKNILFVKSKVNE